ncbi:cob(I)yrinic acid a,c-diamide adenosyltransferase [soil metagenome]
MKIYTKKGDTGETALFGGSKTRKSDIRIHAYGTVDELNSTIGMVLSYSLSDIGYKILKQVQIDLFVVGATLATPDPEKSRIDQVGRKEVNKLEQWIDQLDADLDPLKSFILPGGTGAGSTLHFARTVCRRAERETVELAQREPIPPAAIVYLNRLSDLLFVLARFENKKQNSEETPWIPDRGKSAQ